MNRPENLNQSIAKIYSHAQPYNNGDVPGSLTLLRLADEGTKKYQNYLSGVYVEGKNLPPPGRRPGRLNKGPLELLENLEQGQIKDVKVFDPHIIVTDPEHGGSRSLVEVGIYDGKVVVVKKLIRLDGETKQEFSKRLLIEARSAKLQSDAGFGARFYGVWLDKKRDWHIISEPIAGELTGVMTPRALKQQERLLHYLKEVLGIEQNLPDPNTIVDGNYWFIDGGTFSHAPSHKDLDATKVHELRLMGLLATPPEGQVAYLNYLKSAYPQTWPWFMRYLGLLRGSTKVDGRSTDKNLDVIAGYLEKSGFGPEWYKQEKLRLEKWRNSSRGRLLQFYGDEYPAMRREKETELWNPPPVFRP